VSIAPMPGARPEVRFTSPSSEAGDYGKLMAKHAMQIGDPAFEPHNARRNVLNERGGSSHTVTISVAPAVAPEAGFTQKNGRILPSAINRSSPFEFMSGEMDRN